MAAISTFLSKLASTEPAPGGGACAALSLAQSAALVSKVMVISIVNAPENVRLKFIETNPIVIQTRKNLLQLMEYDTEIFLGLIKTFKLPKNTQEEAAARKAQIAEKYIAATQSPLNMLGEGEKLLLPIIEVIKEGNKNALSDSFCAAKLYEAGMQCAIYNLRINIPHIKEAEKRKYFEEACDVHQRALDKFSTQVSILAKEQNYL